MSVVALLQRMLDLDTLVPVREHVLETASPRVANVKDKVTRHFDKIVRQATEAWGKPDFNNHLTNDARLKTVVPAWSDGNGRNGGEPQALHLCYWRQNGILKYIVLRTEIDLQTGAPMYYDLIVGARRKQIDSIRLDSMREQTDGPIEILKCLLAEIFSKKPKEARPVRN
jgi:hypothetical protein